MKQVQAVKVTKCTNDQVDNNLYKRKEKMCKLLTAIQIGRPSNKLSLV